MGFDLQPVLDAALLAVQEGGRAEWEAGARHFFSNAGDDCLRALVLDELEGPRPTQELRYALAMACGSAVGAVLEAGCKKLGWKVQERVKLERDGLDVWGSLDVHAPGAVIDFKLVGEKSWKRVAKEPAYKNVLQVNGYAVAEAEPGWVLVYLRGRDIFDAIDVDSWRIYSGASDPSLAKQLTHTWETVLGHVLAKEPPPRHRDFAANRFPCGGLWGRCGHFEKCWGGSP